MLKKIIQFIKHDVWRIPLKELSPIHSFLIRQIRIFTVAFRGFAEDKIQLRSSALVIYTLLSIVPVFAMIFGIAKGFGFANKLQNQLMENFQGQEEVLNWLIKFANNMLNNTRGGVIAGIGLIVLFWSVMKVLGHTESAFNNIWQIKRSRTWFRKMSDYLSLMLIAPILIILSSSITVFITTRIESITEQVGLLGYLSPFISFLIRLIPYIITWLLFTLVYIIMPNTRVYFKSGLVAGIIAGTAFTVLQWAYIHFQVYLSGYSAIYGSFAALPLFIIWLKVSWLIVLLGAEISFANQNIEKYEYESESLHINHYHRSILTFLITHLVVKNFEKGKPALTAEDIAHTLEIPIRIVRDILFDLTECGILSETTTEQPKEKAFQPALDIHKITIDYIIKKLEKKGGQDLDLGKNQAFQKLKQAQAQIYESIEKSPGNKLLIEL
jgi:membrane protein